MTRTDQTLTAWYVILSLAMLALISGLACTDRNLPEEPAPPASPHRILDWHETIVGGETVVAPEEALEPDGLTAAGFPGLYHVLELDVHGDRWAWQVRTVDHARGLVGLHRCNPGKVSDETVWVDWSEVGPWRDFGHITRIGEDEPRDHLPPAEIQLRRL
ncbi:MAG: hypothetical protein AAFP22_06570 [Planctomycetota bacterium]